MAMKGEVRVAVISMAVDEREDGSFQVTVPVFPMFHVIGETKSEALETAMEILKGHIEKNFNIKVRAMRLEEDVSDVLDLLDLPATMPPAYVVAELAA